MLRFLLMAGAVLVAGMLIVGFWVTLRIEKGVTDNAGAVTALYVDALVTPLVQEIAFGDALSPSHADQLERVLRRGALHGQISVFKLWTPSGRIAFSDNPDLVGKMPGMSPGLAAALAGRVHTSFDSPFHAASVGGVGTPLLEVYSPVRSVVDGQVIGAAEFYTSAEALADHLAAARLQTWVVVGLVSAGMFLALSLVVAGGSRTIRRQRQSLDDQVAKLSGLLEHNSNLTERVERANHRIAEINEHNLRRISADLHDGPVQQLAFAALRLGPSSDERLQQVRRAIDEAMNEIRDICGGLALPELGDWSVATIARRLVAIHESRTGQKAVLDLSSDLPAISTAAKICVYRFIQEALNNGAKHAPGVQQQVRIAPAGDFVEISVSDDGPGFDPAASSDGLGLAGLRERVAGLKGQLQIVARPGAGTVLVMSLPALAEVD